MINPDFEIGKLRFELNGRNWEPHEVEQIVGMASDAINNIILDAIAEATGEAVSYAESIGATEFIDEIDIQQEGWLYFVRTRSGRTDFSRDRVENLPNLLKNAKTSSDGSRYKVIPIREKTSSAPKMATSSFAQMRDQAQMATAARATLLQDQHAVRSAKADAMANQFRTRIAESIRQKQVESQPQGGGPIAYRTASDKQDASSSWVIPEKDMDMTQFLFTLNEGISDKIEAAVTELINAYKQEY